MRKWCRPAVHLGCRVTKSRKLPLNLQATLLARFRRKSRIEQAEPTITNNPAHDSRFLGPQTALLDSLTAPLWRRPENPFDTNALPHFRPRYPQAFPQKLGISFVRRTADDVARPMADAPLRTRDAGVNIRAQRTPSRPVTRWAFGACGSHLPRRSKSVSARHTALATGRSD